MTVPSPPEGPQPRPHRLSHGGMLPWTRLTRALCGLLLLTGPLSWGACSTGIDASIPSAVVSRGELQVVLGVNGELEAVRSENIGAPNVRGGLKIAMIAEESKRVHKGDVLVEFDRADMEKEIESATSRLSIAKTKIAQKQAQQEVALASAQNDVVRAGLDKQRAEMRITESETVPRVERESAKLDAQQSDLQVSTSQATLQSKRLEAAAELELLRLEQLEAQAKVDQIQRQLDQYTIRAPADGIVMLVETWRGGKMGKATVGDSVYGGNLVMSLPDLSEMRVQAWVHEVDATQVQVGQAVSVVVDARPDAPVVGKVDRVSDLAVKRKEDSEVKYLKVQITLDGTDPALKPGMTVRAEIRVDTLPDVLSVPREAVFYDGSSAYVYRAGLAGWKRTEVTVGRANDSHVVVSAGLEAGDTVALVDPDALDQGKAPSAAGSGPSVTPNATPGTAAPGGT